MKVQEFKKLIREEVRKALKENTYLMSNPSVKEKVEMVIATLKGIDIDGETMEHILDQVGISPFEQVHIVNLSNGERLVTYAIVGERGSKVFGLNGPAARKGLVGDFLHILAYADIDPTKESIAPRVVDLKLK